jgi:hypothetical protein
MVLAYVHEVAEEGNRETVNDEAGVMMSSMSDNAMTEDDDDLQGCYFCKVSPIAIPIRNQKSIGDTDTP